MPIPRRSILLIPAAGFIGCNWIFDRMYYAGMEKFGREKRDILAKRVAAGREDQEKAKEQFQTTLQAFQELTGFDGGDLEKVYNKLNKELERSENRAGQVRERINGIERVARDLFAEWDQEIDKMSSSDLRSRSRALREETESRYKQLIAKMRQAESKMDPVLAAFRDQVLFLKHNLNARAIQSLGDTALAIDGEVAALVKDIEASIAEADAFVATLSGDPA
jgi:predicted nuclease with TOPRIM domain